MCKIDLAGIIFFITVFTILSFNTHAQENFVTSTAAVLSFTDITLSAGTGGPTGSGQTGGHGVMFCDVNNDGRPDLYITMNFDPNPMKDLFFRNTTGNNFADEGDLRGISDFDGGTHGAAFADLDNDGDYDLLNGTTFAATGFPATNDIFRNDGTGFFTHVTAQTGIPVREWPTRAAIAFDMDKDGDLDLFCVSGFDGSADPPDERNEVYRNDGNFQFTAINSGALFTAPAGQGATDTDYDGDGDLDVFAGNRNGDVNLLRNDGIGNFTLITPTSIGITHQGRDGITMGDIDNDDDLDMMLASPPDAALYRNNGGGTFSLITTFANVDGYMGGFADLDLDTDLDLVFAGNVNCYLNDGAGNFSVGPAVPVTGIDDPRAVAFADIDNDGDLDFAFGNKRSRNWLVRNNFNSGNWLKIKLIAPNGQAGAFGAKTRIYPAGQAGGTLLGLRESRSNNGYLGQDDPVLHFGLGSHTAVDVVVNFLDGSTATRANVSANQTLTVDASQAAVERYDVLELILSASQNYQNPYQEASVSATFVGPSGSKTIPGFWDGGDIWRIRFSPDAVGSWSYSTTSNDPGLVASGNFNCIASSRKGGIQPRPQTPLHFQYQNGTPFWWFGETCWAAFRSDAAENLSSTTFRGYIDVRAAQGFNYLHGNLLAGANEGGNPFSSSIVGDRVNPRFWQEVDERVKYMNDRGITVGMLLSWKSDKVGAGSSNPVFDFDWTDFPDQATRLRYCGYLAARYSAYNVVWVLAGEYNEASSMPPNTTAHWTELANGVKNNDPHGRMMAIHGQDQVEVFADESWMNFGDYMQFYETLHNAILDARDHTKPVINAEYAYFLRDQDNDGVVDKPNSATVEEFRQASWDIVMAGGYFVSGFGSTYLGGKREPGPFDVNASKNDPAEAQLPLIKTFFNSLEWWQFQPADSLITGNGTKYCLSDVAGNYVAYIRGTTSAIQLQVVEGTTSQYSIQRFDPRTGSFTELPSQTTSTALNLTTPNSEDWVFLITKSGVSNPIPIVMAFNPTSGSVGTNVTVTGANFTGATAVKFNGVDAVFTVVLDSEISTTVPVGASTGKISVTNAFGTGSSTENFTVLLDGGGTSTFLPKHDSYVRSTKPAQINGSSSELIVRKSSSDYRAYFKFEVTGVSGGVQSAKLRLFVSDGSNDGGGIYLVSNYYTGTTTPWVESGLNWNNAPQISGSILSAVGTVTASTTVEFDVSAAISGNGEYSFAIKNNSSDAAKYHSKEGANRPQLVITTGSANPPVITSFTPTSGPVGTTVTITGSHFTGTISVSFGGVPTTDFSAPSDTQIIATVPAGAVTGKIQITTPNGSATSTVDFTVTTPPPSVPVINSFSPASGPVGTTVTLNGSNFTGTTAVTFNNTAAQFEFVLDSELRATVPTSATTGKIKVTNPAGTGTSTTDFVVTSGGGTQTQTFTPTDDAFVWSAKPTNNYGTSTDLRVRKTSETQIAYFKFNVIGLSGSITSASLQLLCTDASPNGGSVYKVSNNFLNNSSSWTEGGLNWTNAPAVSGSALSSAGSIGVSQTVEWDVKAAITGNGIYSFAITNSSSDAAYYSSKEGTQVPQLVIQTSGSAIAANVVDETVDSKLQPQILSTPESLELFPNYPNPFNLETTIEYALPEAKDVRLSIYNIRGQEVRPLVDEYQSAGFKTVRWDGRDNFGREISSGLYFSRLVVGQTVLMQKLTLQK